MDGQIEGFSITALEIQKLTNKKFTIVAMPFYREVPSLMNKDIKVKKLIVPVEIEETKVSTEWFANKTSQKKIMETTGRELKNWVGYQGEWKVKDVSIGDEDRLAIFVK